MLYCAHTFLKMQWMEILYLKFSNVFHLCDSYTLGLIMPQGPYWTLFSNYHTTLSNEPNLENYHAKKYSRLGKIVELDVSESWWFMNLVKDQLSEGAYWNNLNKHLLRNTGWKRAESVNIKLVSTNVNFTISIFVSFAY